MIRIHMKNKILKLKEIAVKIKDFQRNFVLPRLKMILLKKKNF